MGKKYELSHVVNEARTGTGKRALTSRLPQIIEPPKTVLLLRGHSTSAIGNTLLNELHLLKKPYSKKLQRKNEVLPFETGGEAHIENLCRLNDCTLFALTNNTKKRPHNLVFGRTFAHRLLDMVECSVMNYMPSAGFTDVPVPAPAPGSTPLLIFNGDDYDATPTTKALRSLLLDLFRGPDDVKMLNVAGLDRVMVFTLRGQDKVLVRHYGIQLKRASGSQLPQPELTEIGPKFDLGVRRVQTAAEGLMKVAMRKPRDPTLPYKRKNVSRDDMGDKMGRIHVGRQDLSTMALARMKGLGKKRKEGVSRHAKDGNGKEKEDVGNEPGENVGDDDEGGSSNSMERDGGGSSNSAEGSPLKKAKVDTET